MLYPRVEYGDLFRRRGAQAPTLREQLEQKGVDVPAEIQRRTGPGFGTRLLTGIGEAAQAESRIQRQLWAPTEEEKAELGWKKYIPGYAMLTMAARAVKQKRPTVEATWTRGMEPGWKKTVAEIGIGAAVSPTTYVTGGIGGLSKAAGRAGATVAPRFVARMAKSATVAKAVPHLEVATVRAAQAAGATKYPIKTAKGVQNWAIERAAQRIEQQYGRTYERLMTNALRVGEAAGREGYVSKRLIQQWIKPLATSAGEERLLMQAAHIAATAGEKAAAGGVRFMGQQVLPRAALRRGAEAVGAAAERAGIRAPERLGRTMRLGYIVPSEALTPVQKEMVEEAIRGIFRVRGAAQEMAGRRTEVIFGKLSKQERELLTGLVQLEGLPIAEETPRFAAVLKQRPDLAEQFYALPRARQQALQEAGRSYRTWMEELAPEVPGYRERYVMGMRAGARPRGRKALGPTKAAPEYPKTYKTIAEREQAAREAADTMAIVADQWERAVAARGRGEKTFLVELASGELQDWRIDRAIGRLAKQYGVEARRLENLIPEKDLAKLAYERAVAVRSVQARREMFDVIKQQVAVPLAERPRFPGFVETTYKELKGQLIPDEVARAVQTHFNTLISGPPRLHRVWELGTNVFRYMATAARPGWQVINFMWGNMYNGAYLGKMNPARLWDSFLKGGKLLHILGDDAGQFFSMAGSTLREGGFARNAMENWHEFLRRKAGEWSAETVNIRGQRVTLGQLAQDLLSEGGMVAFGRQELPAAADILERMWLPLARVSPQLQRWTMDLPRRTSTWMERWSKAALFLDKRLAGWSKEDAGTWMRKHLFAYDELTPREQTIRGLAVPFYTWIKNNTGLQAQSFLSAPGRQFGVARATAVWQRNMQPVGFEHPEWIQQQGALPYFRDENEARYLAHYIPLFDISRIFDLRQLMSNFYPYYTLPAELALEREIFTGRKLQEGDMVPFPVPGAKAIPADIRKRFDIVEGEWPIGSGHKQWIWPQKSQFALARVFPTLAYAGRFAERPLPEDRVNLLTRYLSGIALVTIKRGQQERVKEARERAAWQAMRRRYGAVGMLPPTPTQAERAQEYLEAQ